MNKFGILTERINKIQSLLPISIVKTVLFQIYLSIALYEQNVFNITQRFLYFCIFQRFPYYILYFCLFNVVFMDKFYYNTPIYKTILLKFLKSTEKYYINRTPVHFRGSAKAVLKRAARLRIAFSTARPTTPKKWFYRLI